MFQKYLLSSLFFLAFALLPAQNPSMGMLKYEAGTQEGYTFFSPYSGTKAWMVDNCGRLVNSWDRGTQPGLAAYFLENGYMLRTYKTDLKGPFTSASNAGGLELVDWDNNTVWSIEINTATELSHHDAVMMPNGNFLIPVWELVYSNELIESGRDPNQIAPEGFRWSEKIVEIEPTGNSGGNFVWQWEIRHHYIQDFDATKQNYGVISEHPELFDINLPTLNNSNSNSTRDWNHINAIDYNAELDQILLSVRNSDEIWILDHSTSTAEAATHTGGRYGKGGDILYRWGNAAAYQRGTTADQKLFGQHGVHWIKSGLKDAGKIMIFNNGNGRPGQDYSTAEILSPSQDSLGFYTQSATAAFGPLSPDWIFGDAPNDRAYSAYLSNAQRLANGNTLLNYGSLGNIREVNSAGETVWIYEIPLYGDTPGNQGQNPSNNSSFRAYKFAPDFAGFKGINIVAGNTIENGNNPLGCPMFVDTKTLNAKVELPTVFFRNNEIWVTQKELQELDIQVFSTTGQYMISKTTSEITEQISSQNFTTGTYIISFYRGGNPIGSQVLFVP